MLTPFPGTVDFAAWEKTPGRGSTRVDGMPITRHWLIPQAQRPKVYTPHPVMSPDEIRRADAGVWDQFYSLREHLAAVQVRHELRGRGWRSC